MTPKYQVLEIFGEGKTDIGKSTAPELPDSGIVTILVHALCGHPTTMRVKRKATSFLQGKGWVQKVKFAKRQACINQSAGVVFVLDTEGEHKQRLKQLEEGRDTVFRSYPMAVGAAHPCIEAWLLADGKAIKKALDLATVPKMPDAPEDLPAPQQDRKHNPKTVLAKCAETKGAEVSAADKDNIARAIKDIALVSARCPLGFGPFAVEVEQRIRPLFTEAETSGDE